MDKAGKEYLIKEDYCLSCLNPWFPLLFRSYQISLNLLFSLFWLDSCVTPTFTPKDKAFVIKTGNTDQVMPG